jgi:hypothetical protein
MPNEPQPQGTCELQGRRIEAPGLPALMLPVNAHRRVLADNTEPVLEVLLEEVRVEGLMIVVHTAAL